MAVIDSGAALHHPLLDEATAGNRQVGPASLIDLTPARTSPGWPRVSVVIPALNEAQNLPHVLNRLPDDLLEVILVDGGSVDDTINVARRLLPGVRILRQTRRGKGNALMCGFAACRGNIVVMLDADGSADPGEIPAFVRTLLGGAHFA